MVAQLAVQSSLRPTFLSCGGKIKSMERYRGYNKKERGSSAKALLVLILLIVLSIYFIRVRGLRDEIDGLEREVSRYEEDLRSVEGEYEDMKGRVQDLEEREAELEDRLNRTYQFYSPTPEELKEELEDIGVHEREWLEDEYVSLDFSYDLLDELHKRGIFSCITAVYFEDMEIGHGLLRVNTTDGARFVEPQDNTVFEEMETGDNFCELVDWDCEWVISEVNTCEL